MEYNLYIFTFGSFLFLSFSLHMFLTNNGNTYLNKLLAAMMLMRGLMLLYFGAVNTGQTFFVSLLFKPLEPIIFGFGAFLYLYVRGFIKDENRMRKRDLLHFIPILFAFIDTLPWYFLDAASQANVIADIIAQRVFYFKENFEFFPYHAISIFKNGLLLIYLILIWRIVWQSGIIKNIRNNSIVANWILFFVIVTTLSNLSFLINSFVYIGGGAITSNLFFNNYRSFIQAGMMLGFFGYVFYKPKVLYGFVFVSKDYVIPTRITDLEPIDTEHADQHIESQHIPFVRNTRKQSPTIHEEELERLKAQMISLIETEKPFLNPDFSLGDLANQVRLPPHHCSYILNEYFGKNFREWVNGYRIDFFIMQYHRLIASQTIASIALASGFKNKNTFYSAFEKATGQTPSQYFGS